jgi:hypothetical protein
MAARWAASAAPSPPHCEVCSRAIHGQGTARCMWPTQNALMQGDGSEGRKYIRLPAQLVHSLPSTSVPCMLHKTRRMECAIQLPVAAVRIGQNTVGGCSHTGQFPPWGFQKGTTTCSRPLHAHWLFVTSLGSLCLHCALAAQLNVLDAVPTFTS